MGKFTANPQKCSSIVQFLCASRTAHSIKDLEKHLPSMASVNWMQVKDYLQSLSDDDRIRVEKIGSGNWYWSFAADEVKAARLALEGAKAACGKARKTVSELRQKLEATVPSSTGAAALGKEGAGKAGQGVDDGFEEGEENERKALLARHAVLQGEVDCLKRDLDSYAGWDTEEIEERKAEVSRMKVGAESCTDEIYAMESWLRRMGQDEEGMKMLRMGLYGDELDEEQGVLRELV